MSVTVKLKETDKAVPDQLDTCVPYVFQHKRTKECVVVIATPGGFLFFEESRSSIGISHLTLSNPEENLKWTNEHYDFVRKMTADESVTFTGKK